MSKTPLANVLGFKMADASAKLTRILHQAFGESVLNRNLGKQKSHPFV